MKFITIVLLARHSQRATEWYLIHYFIQFQAVIIYVPVPKQKAFQKIQTRLVRELEKKFSGKHVVFIAERKILPKPQRNTRNPLKQKRPRSRTLTAVFDAILEDLVFPAEIVGKRIRVKLDGSQLIKVHLDKNQQTTIEHKVNIHLVPNTTPLNFHCHCVARLIHSNYQRVSKYLAYIMLLFKLYKLIRLHRICVILKGDTKLLEKNMFNFS